MTSGAVNPRKDSFRIQSVKDVEVGSMERGGGGCMERVTWKHTLPYVN